MLLVLSKLLALCRKCNDRDDATNQSSTHEQSSFKNTYCTRKQRTDDLASYTKQLKRYCGIDLLSSFSCGAIGSIRFLTALLSTNDEIPPSTVLAPLASEYSAPPWEVEPQNTHKAQKKTFLEFSTARTYTWYTTGVSKRLLPG